MDATILLAASFVLGVFLKWVWDSDSNEITVNSMKSIARELFPAAHMKRSNEEYENHWVELMAFVKTAISTREELKSVCQKHLPGVLVLDASYAKGTRNKESYFLPIGLMRSCVQAEISGGKLKNLIPLI